MSDELNELSTADIEDDSDNDVENFSVTLTVTALFLSTIKISATSSASVAFFSTEDTDMQSLSHHSPAAFLENSLTAISHIRDETLISGFKLSIRL